MIPVKIKNKYNNDWVYMHQLLEYESYINYNTDNTTHATNIKYYPKYNIIVVSKCKIDIIYILCCNNHINELYDHVKKNLVANDLNTNIEIVNHLETLDPQSEDTKYVTLRQRIYNARINIKLIKESWNDPFMILDINDVNDMFGIDINYYIKYIEQLFRINICQ